MEAIHTQSAQALIERVRQGELSSRQLTEYYLERIKTLNPSLNAIVWLDEAGALAQADAADERQAQGERLGPLHGLPMTVKDCFEATHMPTTAGSPSLKNHIPGKDSDVVARLKAAGAIILGHTNVPLWASDLQSYNRVYGRTNNPWDKSRTPGGSSGGAAAALAAGLTPLEVGSDVGGSIRTPSHFCGTLGHHPSHGVISMRGHVPGPPGMLSAPDLAVAGPMARTADDLEMLFDVMLGAAEDSEAVWKPALPPCELSELKSFRAAIWLRDPHCPVDESVDRVYQGLLETLSRAQCPWQFQQPLELREVLPTYFNLLGSVVGASFPTRQQIQLRLLALLSRFMRLPGIAYGLEEFARAISQSHHKWLQWNERRHLLRETVETFFEQFDVLLCPIVSTAAFTHQTDKPIAKRTLQVNGQARPYSELMTWISVATTLGLPATAVPVGFTEDGLPVCIQVIGARGKDRQTIQFARLLEREGLGFKAPPE